MTTSVGSPGGGQAVPVTADGTAAPFFSDGKCYSISGELSAWNYWWGQLQNGAVWGIDTAFLPTDTPTSELALQFECFVAVEYGEGPVFRIYLKGNEAHNYTNYRPVSDFTGKTEVGQWMQCSIPLSELVDETTWGESKNVTVTSWHSSDKPQRKRSIQHRNVF